AALAHRGVYREFAVRLEDAGVLPGRRVVSPEVASLLGNILSDPDARRLEFGSGSLLNLPVQTAVKTGTSSDYRDSWALGYNDRYVVGVWMGNLDQSSTLGVTGSTGPALVLRGTFDVLNRYRETQALWLSPRLQHHVICADTGIAFEPGLRCPRRSEYFVPGTGPERSARLEPPTRPRDEIRLGRPTPGLHMAWDPRLPARHQAFEFLLQGVADSDVVDWRIDDGAVIRETGPRYLWPLSRGEHAVAATVWREGQVIARLEGTRFLVK
ncbi:MAG: penicillin-binding protein 1C, partial [Gammaproteobacteria bacterium]